MKLKALVGSGGKIALLTLPFLLIGLILNILSPSLLSVGRPSLALNAISIIMLIPGLIIWLWSVVLILIKVPQGKLITDGPYALVKHPLYTGVALLVLPWLGFLMNTWLSYCQRPGWWTVEEAARQRTWSAQKSSSSCTRITGEGCRGEKMNACMPADIKMDKPKCISFFFF